MTTQKFTPLPRGKNQRRIALWQVGEGIIVDNRTKANSMCESATAIGVKVGTQVQPDGVRILVFRKE